MYLQLGTNDSVEGVWNIDKFIKNYIEIVRALQNLKSKPKVYLAVPPPLSKDGVFGMN